MLTDFDEDPFGSAPAVAEKVRRPPKDLPDYAPAPAQPGKPITVTLPYPPTSNMYWRSRIVAPKGAAAFVSHYISTEGKQFKESAGWLLRAAGVHKPLPGRVHVHLQLWPKRPLDWAKRAKADPLYWADSVQRHDIDNCRKAVYDALKEIAFGDDKCVWQDSGEVMEPDGRDPCVVVTITPLTKVNPQVSLL